MTEKMTMENMSVEMDILWGRIKELELTLSRKLEDALRNTSRKLKHQLEAERETAPGTMVISNQIRRELIELTAYHKAEQRGFCNGDPVDDWLQAEKEVDRLLLGGQSALDEAAEVTPESIHPGNIVLPKNTSAHTPQQEQ